MPLTPQQEDTLYSILRNHFASDTPDEFALRLVRLIVRNPSAAQRTLVQSLVSQVLAIRDATLAAYDTTVASTKTDLQTDRDELAAIPGSI
jgi:hypothetical protein